MEPYISNRFFAMFDIIGFSNLVKTKGTQELFKLVNKNVIFAMQYAATRGFINQEQNGRLVSVPDLKKKEVEFQIFSDTIIFYTQDDSLKSYIDIITTAQRLMTFSFTGQTPFRGAIGYGDLITNNLNVMIGTSVIDAYIGEQNQVWSGCILTKTCEEFCKRNQYFYLFDKYITEEIKLNKSEDLVKNSKKFKTLVVEYNVPKQKKKPNLGIEYYSEVHYVINWTHWVGEGRFIENAFQPSENPHHQNIKNNTMIFNEWARLAYNVK